MCDIIYIYILILLQEALLDDNSDAISNRLAITE